MLVPRRGSLDRRLHKRIHRFKPLSHPVDRDEPASTCCEIYGDGKLVSSPHDAEEPRSSRILRYLGDGATAVAMTHPVASWLNEEFNPFRPFVARPNFHIKRTRRSRFVCAKLDKRTSFAKAVPSV